MRTLFAAAVTAALALPAAAADVGVSINIGQPGFYGRIDIGNVPPPVLVYREPIVVRPAPVGVVYEPIYLRVPPGHAKKWDKHCHRYSACGRPVYFVQDRWYNDVYVPHYRSRHEYRGGGHEHEYAKGGKERGNGHGHGHGHGHGKGHGKGHDKD